MQRTRVQVSRIIRQKFTEVEGDSIRIPPPLRLTDIEFEQAVSKPTVVEVTPP